MKKGKLIFWGVIFIIASWIVGCTSTSPLKYKIVKYGDASESKTIAWVKINSGSFVQISPGTVNMVSAGNINCPISGNKINSLYFVLIRPVSPFDTLDRNIFLDTITNCNADLVNIAGTSYRNKTVIDSVVVPSSGNFRQLVTWPPTR